MEIWAVVCLSWRLMDQRRGQGACSAPLRAGWGSGHSLPCNVIAVVQLHPLPLVPLLDLPRLMLCKVTAWQGWTDPRNPWHTCVGYSLQTPWCASSKTAQDSSTIPLPLPKLQLWYFTY